MPYNPVKKYPGLLNNIKNRGFTKEVKLREIENEIMRELGAINPKTIARHIEAMERLGFIRHVGNGVFSTAPNSNETMDKIGKIAEKELDRYGLES